MITLVFVAIYPEMEQIAYNTFNEQNALPEYNDSSESFELRVINVTSSSTSYVLHNLEGGDVLIARGGIVYDLKRHGFELPVVEIIVNGSDLLRALNTAKTKYGRKKTAVIGSANMLLGLETISDAVELPVAKYYLHENSIEEVISNVDKAHSDGYETIIGGTNGSKYAKSIGLNSVLIESGQESIWYALSEARRIAQISKLERQKTAMYRTIMDSVYEGVIAVDNSFKVLLLNSAAQKILGLFPSQYVGKSIEEVFYPTTSKG